MTNCFKEGQRYFDLEHLTSCPLNSTVRPGLTMTFEGAENDMVTVHCDATDGRPEAGITWYINGQQPPETPTVGNPINDHPDLSNTNFKYGPHMAR